MRSMRSPACRPLVCEPVADAVAGGEALRGARLTIGCIKMPNMCNVLLALVASHHFGHKLQARSVCSLHSGSNRSSFLPLLLPASPPQDVVVQSARPYGQRAVYKFAQYIGAKSLAGRHTPGTFTNQVQKQFEEPRLLILTDPR